jgi:hypothetical protein
MLTSFCLFPKSKDLETAFTGSLRREALRAVLEMAEADKKEAQPRAAVKRVYCMMPANE